MLHTIESYEARIEHAQKRIKELEGARLSEKISDAEADMNRWENTLHTIEGLRPAIAKLYPRNTLHSHSAMNHLNGLSNEVDNAYQTASTEHQRLTNMLNTLDRYKKSIPEWEKAIEARRQQEKRLRGGISGVVSRLLGRWDFDPTQDLQFIIDCIRVQTTTSEALHQRHKERYKERYAEAQNDVVEWVKANEVEYYCTESVEYHMNGYHSDGTILYRIVPDIRPLEDAEGKAMDSMWTQYTIDTACRLMQVPFGHSDCGQMLRGCQVFTYAPTMGRVTTDRMLEIDADTETIRPVIMVMKGPNNFTIRTQGGVVIG